MRIVFDLQACQTQASRGRGVGRYSGSLTRHIALVGADDVRACLNGNLADTAGPVIAAFEDVLPASRFSSYRHAPVNLQGDAERAAARDVAECLVRRHWLALQPDVLHVAHVFEGFAADVVVPRALPSVPGLVRSATLYDFIPLRFAHHYLERPEVRRLVLRKAGHAPAVRPSARDLRDDAPRRHRIARDRAGAHHHDPRRRRRPLHATSHDGRSGGGVPAALGAQASVRALHRRRRFPQKPAPVR